MSEEQIAQQLDSMDQKFAKMGTFSSLLQNILGSVIFSGVIALILGAIMKKKADLFENNAGGAI
jgi:hypothetical protein